MLVMKNAVTRPYWSSMYDYARRMIRRRDARQVCRGVKVINCGSRSRLYFCGDEEDPIAWLFLVHRPGWSAWEVSQVWTFPEARSKGLAKKLYKAAVNTDRLILASGNLHTQYSQAIWRSFVKKNIFNIWAQDFRHLEHTSPVWIEDNELQCKLNIYLKPSDPARPRTDVRLIAIKKD